MLHETINISSLFVYCKSNVICFVDDLIFQTPDESDIDELAKHLISISISLKHESDEA